MWRSDFTYFGPTSGSTCARMHYYTVSRFCVLRVMYQNKWIPKFQLSCSYSLFSLKFLTLPNVQNGRFSLKSWRTTATLKRNNSRTIWDRALKLCMVIHFIKAFQMTLTLNMSLEVLILLGTTYWHCESVVEFDLLHNKTKLFWVMNTSSIPNFSFFPTPRNPDLGWMKQTWQVSSEQPANHDPWPPALVLPRRCMSRSSTPRATAPSAATLRPWRNTSASPGFSAWVTSLLCAVQVMLLFFISIFIR